MSKNYTSNVRISAGNALPLIIMGRDFTKDRYNHTAYRGQTDDIPVSNQNTMCGNKLRR